MLVAEAARLNPRLRDFAFSVAAGIGPLWAVRQKGGSLLHAVNLNVADAGCVALPAPLSVLSRR